MKRIFVLMIAVLAVLSLCACTAKPEPEPLLQDVATPVPEVTPTPTPEPTPSPTPTLPPTALELVQASGTLRVAICPDYAPYEFTDKDGNLVGSDVTFAEKLCEALSLSFTPVIVDSFDEVLAAIADGRADVAISCIGYSDERRESYQLSMPYYGQDTEADTISDKALVVAAKAIDETLIFAVSEAITDMNTVETYPVWLDAAMMLAEKLRLF